MRFPAAALQWGGAGRSRVIVCLETHCVGAPKPNGISLRRLKVATPLHVLGAVATDADHRGLFSAAVRTGVVCADR